MQFEAPKFHILNLLKNSLIDVKYTDICNQKGDADLLIGSATLKVVNAFESNEKLLTDSTSAKIWDWLKIVIFNRTFF